MKLHYPEGMKLHGENACKYHGFEKYDWKTDRDKPAMFWLYFDDDYKYLANHAGEKIVFWHNADVKLLAGKFAAQYIGLVRDPKIKHVCHNNLLRDELAVMGIHAIVRPIFWGDVSKYKPEGPLTNDCYMTANPGRGIEYGESVLNAMAWACPDWTFHVFGIDPLITTYCDNVKYYGWISEDEMDETTKNFSICFRYNFHDGFSQTVMKALLRGQSAITTIDYGYLTYYCRTYSDILKTIQNIDNLQKETIDAGVFTNFDFL